MIRPVNPVFRCFTVHALIKGRWRRQCHDHAPEVPYKFFEEKDAEGWVERNLPREIKSQIKEEIFIYDKKSDCWT